MRVLLVALNAKYIHSNLAVYSLKAYASKYKRSVELAEYTINNYADKITADIYKKKPDLIAFSCYIWNIRMVEEIARELHKVLPKAVIWFGGPEVSYDARERLNGCDYLTGIMMGEGEKSFSELLDYYIEGKGKLQNIRGLAFKEGEEVYVNQEVELLDLNEIPFPYEDAGKFENKIIYYESSRGCPFSCSYCLSSIDKRVRFRDTERVKKELQIFLDNKVSQVKFVDRTFNCNRRHADEIWTYIKEHDNGITNFHFEISADLINEEELNILAGMRRGLVQLEIGVQSANENTLRAICRKTDLDKLSYVVSRINHSGNIHQHLDLIAGLPCEDYASFCQSFARVYAMKPEQLQLGFLKVLKGSAMFCGAQEDGILYNSAPPYEVLSTKWITYDDILELKKVEDMVEVYYNSGQFRYSMQYLCGFFENPFDLYKNIGGYYEEHGLFHVLHSRLRRCEILLDYANRSLEETAYEEKTFSQILLFDIYLRENSKSRPSFAEDNSRFKKYCTGFYKDRDKIKKYLPDYMEYEGRQIARMTHMEHFDIDIDKTVRIGKTVRKEQFLLFNYQKRNPLNYEAEVTKLEI